MATASNQTEAAQYSLWPLVRWQPKWRAPLQEPPDGGLQEEEKEMHKKLRIGYYAVISVVPGWIFYGKVIEATPETVTLLDGWYIEHIKGPVSGGGSRGYSYADLLSCKTDKEVDGVVVNKWTLSGEGSGLYHISTQHINHAASSDRA